MRTNTRRTRPLGAMLLAILLGASTASANPGTYQYDDASPNFSLGPNFGDGFVALNAFTVNNRFDTITSLEVWVSVPIELEVTLSAGVWADPNQDGDPSDAVLLQSTGLTLSPDDDGLLSIVLDSPIDVGEAGDSFFAGVFYDTDPQNLNIGADSDYAGPPISWFVEYDNTAPDPNDLSGAESRNYALMIRAIAEPVVAQPLDVTETTDFEGDDIDILNVFTDLGQLDAGVNLISGSIVDSNDDTVRVHIPFGLQIEQIDLAVSNHVDSNLGETRVSAVSVFVENLTVNTDSIDGNGLLTFPGTLPGESGAHILHVGHTNFIPNSSSDYQWQITVAAPACDGDANGDCVVDVNDISFVLFRLGDPCAAPGCEGDANLDGVVDVNDISFVLFRLGFPCP